MNKLLGLLLAVGMILSTPAFAAECKSTINPITDTVFEYCYEKGTTPGTAIGLYCEAGKFSVRLFGKQFLSSNGEMVEVTYRVDKRTPITEQWMAFDGTIALTTNKQTLKNFANGQILTVQTVSYDYDMEILQFPLPDLLGSVNKLHCLGAKEK